MVLRISWRLWSFIDRYGHYILEDIACPLSKFCAPYSAIGALFMFWVGAMIAKQPFFLSGLDDTEVCKDNAFGAMWLFIVIFGISVACLIYESASQNNHDRGLDRPAYSPILPPGMTDYEISTELEMSDMALITDNLIMDSDSDSREIM